MADKIIPLSMRLPLALVQVIKDRAKFNLRPVTKEVEFLIEVGLANESKGVRTMLKLLEAASKESS